MVETEEIRRYDERNNVQGRLELRPGTPAWEEYYEKHPELKEVDRQNQKFEEISVGHPADNNATSATVEILRDLSREDMVDGPVAQEKIEMTPERATEKIKGFAEYMGIDVVRIGPLNPMYVYSHKGRHYGRTDTGEPKVGTPIELTHKNAIVLVVGLDTKLLRGAPKKQVMFAIHKAYYQLGTIAIAVARYIRLSGYPARAHIMRNYQLIIPPIAIDAGVGELGRNGIVISKEFGPAIKMAVVTTDLPLIHDPKANMGVDAVCRKCRICAQNCPAGALNHGEKKIIRGVERYPFTPEACFGTWKTTGTDCGVCLISCPFTRDSSFRQSICAHPLSPGDELPEELAIKIEQMRSEGHDPDAQPQYPWMEEQPEIWRKYRFGR